MRRRPRSKSDLIQQSCEQCDPDRRRWPGSLLTGAPTIRPRAEFPRRGAAGQRRRSGVSRPATDGLTVNLTPLHQGCPRATPETARPRNFRSWRGSGGRRRGASTPASSDPLCKTPVHRRYCNCKAQISDGPAICDHDQFKGEMRMFSAIVRPISSSPAANYIDACVDAWSTELV